MTGRVELEGFSRVSGLHSRKCLGGEGVEPGKTIRPGDGDHGAVGKIDDGFALGQQFLFPQRVSVVLGRRTDRTGEGRKRAPRQDF